MCLNYLNSHVILRLSAHLKIIFFKMFIMFKYPVNVVNLSHSCLPIFIWQRAGLYIYFFFDPKQLLWVSCITRCYFAKCLSITPVNILWIPVKKLWIVSLAILIDSKLTSTYNSVQSIHTGPAQPIREGLHCRRALNFRGRQIQRNSPMRINYD